MAFYVTSPVDMQNYTRRIKSALSPAVELVVLPENLPYEVPFDKSCCPRPYSKFPKITDKLAMNVARHLKKNEIEIAQVHSPSGIRFDGLFDERVFDTLFGFCDIIRNESGLRQLSFNYHDSGLDMEKVPGGSYGEKREKVHRMLDTFAASVAEVNRNHQSPCLIFAENNGIGENHNPPETCDTSKLKVADMLAKDMDGRPGIDLKCFDIPHAWRVVGCMKEGVDYPNILWCKEHYEQQSGGLPPSATDFTEFIKEMAPNTGWIHIAGENNLVTHKRIDPLHDDNIIDYRTYIKVFREAFGGNTIKYKGKELDIGVTVETIDCMTREGFDRIKCYYSYLNGLFNGPLYRLAA